MQSKSIKKPSKGDRTPVLVLCHYALCFIMLLCKLILFMSVWTKSLFTALLSALRVGGPHSLDTFQLFVKNLNRTPEHVALIVNEEQIFVNDIANAVVCCVVVGIGTISLYDHRGMLQARRSQLELAIRAALEAAESQLGRSFGIRFAGIANDHLDLQLCNGYTDAVRRCDNGASSLINGGTHLTDGCKIMAQSNGNGHNGHANGNADSDRNPVAGTGTTIFTFSFADSRPRFAKTIRDLIARRRITDTGGNDSSVTKSVETVELSESIADRAKAQSYTNLSRRWWTADELNKAVVQEYGMSVDPELAVVFGNCLNLAGYPAWQTRLTEIVRIATHHRFTPRTLYTALRRFAKCEQRFGK